MRRKSNLDERLKSCDHHLILVEGGEFYKKTEEEKYRILSLSEIFKNDNEVYLDLGCGNGEFSLSSAKNYPEKNFIGVEKISNVLIVGAERAKEENPNNCAFLNCAVENLNYYLPKNSISGIFLNFSCPYPKGTYKKRRLTHPRFLSLYTYLLKDGGTISLKTDSEDFFEFSKENLLSCDYIIDFETRDLYGSAEITDNISTEYERHFLEIGKKILKLVARKP